jgi:predicted ribosomally synthesized peptide with nif11-like leader
MSQQTLTQLSAALESDKLLEAKMRAAKSLDDVVSIAAQHGHAVTLEDLKTTAANLKERELSDDELDGVSGGKGKKPVKDTHPYLEYVLKDCMISSF